jgi:hypothetical protein
MKILCELFDHSIHPVDLIVHEIQANEFNRGRVPNIMKCRRCGWTLDLNDKEAIVAYTTYSCGRNFFKKLWDLIVGKNKKRVS